MARLVTMGTDMKSSHALGRCPCGRIGTPLAQVVVPANVALALQAKVVVLELSWTTLLSSRQFAPFVGSRLWSCCRLGGCCLQWS